MPTLRSPLPWVWLTTLGLVALGLTGVLAYLVPVAHERDASALNAFTELDRPRLTSLWLDVRSLCDPSRYAVLGLLVLLVAALRRRGRTVAAIAFLLVATGLTTQTLKPLLAAPRYDEWLGYQPVAAGSWPSGHSTAAMTLALCAVLAAPRRLRPTVGAAGAAFALVIGVSNVVLQLHWPSDVVGGYLVSGTWTCAVLAVLAWAEARRPSAHPERGRLVPVDYVLPSLFALVCAGALGSIVLGRAGKASDFAAQHPTFVLAASVITGLALLLPLGLTRGTT